MSSSAVASLLIAFVATMGAVPLLRSMLQSRQLQQDLRDEAVPFAPRGIAGAGMLFGVLISLFYVDSGASGAAGLLVAVVALGFIGLQSSRRRPQTASGSENRGLELGAAAVAGLALLIITPFTAAEWSLPVLLIMATVVVTPLAVSSLGRSHPSTAALPAGIVLIQLILLVFLSVLASADLKASVPFSELAVILLPAAGALMGALVYLCRMPWRSQAAISTGIATRLCLGLLVGWAAARICMQSQPEHACMVALLWILAVPVFDMSRQVVFGILARAFPHRAWAGWLYPFDGKRSSKWTFLFTLVCGAIGIALWHLKVTDFWTLWALLPAWLSYLLMPVMQLTLDIRHRPGVLDARS